MADRSNQGLPRGNSNAYAQGPEDRTVIGAGCFVRGRINGSGDLEIAGRVEGDVTVSGEVIVDTAALVASAITARRIVVRGAVKGDLVASESVIIESGARVVGDLRAPRVAIAEGGLVRGHVQTGAASAGRMASRSAMATATTEGRAMRPVANPPAAVIPTAPTTPTTPTTPTRVAPKPTQAASAAPPSNHGSERDKAAPPPRTGSMVAGRLGPPPPVVASLKKGTKAIAHHKKR